MILIIIKGLLAKKNIWLRAWGMEHGAWGMGHRVITNYDPDSYRERMTNDE